MYKRDKEIKLVEICRSFTFKLNTGNYQSCDFFASQKAEVPEKDAVKTSEALYEFCKSEVIASVNAYKLENLPLKELTEPLKPNYRKNYAIAKEEQPKSEEAQKKADELSQERGLPVIQQ